MNCLLLVSLMVMLCLCFLVNFATAYPHLSRHSHLFAGREELSLTPVLSSTQYGPSAVTAMPCSGNNCAAATHTPEIIKCSAANGTQYVEVPEMNDYTIICNIDFPAQNIYPFVLAGSFEECLSQCEKVNKGSVAHCAGFVFAPERVDDADDCYLKSSLNSPESATIPLVGATLTNFLLSTIPTVSITASSTMLNPDQPVDTKTNLFRAPRIIASRMLGATVDTPTTQYVKHPLAVPQKLAASLLVPGINTELITKYSIASDTGSWSGSSSPVSLTIANMSVPPRLSRDGGKGGCINGTNIFIFCDTATFQDGNMNGFVSSSVAVDITLNARVGGVIALVDQIGGWQDDVGRMRGFGPMTTGEEAFNIQLSGQGHRYAVWPESSPIPLNNTHALLYASLVYDEVDMQTQQANFTNLGNTLLVLSIDPVYGPGAQRVENQLFRQNEVSWGSLGGLRSWGQAGIGGMDGMVYVFGQVNGGVLVARTNPFGIADRSTYSYWNGATWSSGMVPPSATSYFIDEPVMDLDIIYSPYHCTFIMVYLTPDADNTFYFRYLTSDSAILPPYAGGVEDYAENIVTKEWSPKQVLYKAPEPPILYIYAGGVHAGYFGDQDLANGGTKMLLSWTEHTGQDAGSPATGYSHMTVVVELD